MRGGGAARAQGPGPAIRAEHGVPAAARMAGGAPRGGRRAGAARQWLAAVHRPAGLDRSEEHTSELQSRGHLVCRLLLEKKKDNIITTASSFPCFSAQTTLARCSCH